MRALYFGMYAFLLVGSISMVYPFLLMISGSTKSAVDIKYFDVVPQFLRDDAWLYRKHVESLFNERMLNRNMVYDDDVTAFDTIDLPAEAETGWVREWERFLAENSLPPYAYTVGHLQANVSRTIPRHLRGFKRYLRDRYGCTIDDVNASLGTEFISWNALTVESRLVLSRRDKPLNTAFGEALYAYQASVPTGMRVYASVEGFYKKRFLKPQYSLRIEEYNQAHSTDYATYDDVHLSRVFPVDGSLKEQQDWEDFVRSTLAMVWIRASDGAAPSYRAFLRAKHGTLDNLNKNYGADYATFDQVPLVEEPPAFGMRVSDWEAFLSGWRDPETGEEFKLPSEYLRIHSVEFMFRDWLREKYGTLGIMRSAINGSESVAAGPLSGQGRFDRLAPPQEAVHYAWYFRNKKELRWEFVSRNYKAVAEYLLLHGRGILNTVIYCSLAILLALTINPLAAYAMSRYRMPSSYKILLFLMCTMAFPPMVTQIPNFLMLRKLGLLNTFAALVLPGMANGYAIFLLKGFFDSQPRELYESAQLDGASEWTIFWQLTMALSKPILAVIGLQAFTLAYSNFMFAFVVCQDEKMWTLMVWLYQLQQRSGQAVMYASLIIAAIPTFLIFLFCQNIIMRGIVVPSEK